MTENITSSLEPIFDRVAVRRLVQEDAGSGIIIAPSGAKSADRAEVVAVGPGRLDLELAKHIPVGLEVGDTVLINPMLGMKTEIDGQEIIFQKEGEILSKIRE